MAFVQDYPDGPFAHLPTHTHPDHQTSFINFLHLLQSTAYSLFSLRAWQSFSTTSLQVLFGLPLGLGPSTLLHGFLHGTEKTKPNKTNADNTKPTDPS